MDGILAVDVGNSFVKLAPFGPAGMGEVERYATRDAAALIARRPRSGGAALLSSVVPAETARIVAALSEPTGAAVLVVGADLPWPMPVAIRDPSTLGTDRVVAAFAARELLGAPIVVVTAGTAVTVDLVAADGTFAGGAIAPGLGVLASALGHAAPALPRPPFAPEALYPGQSSVEAVQVGLAATARGMLRELVAAARHRAAAEATVLLSGGDADLAHSLLGDSRAVRIDHLVLRGLGFMAGRRRPPSDARTS